MNPQPKIVEKDAEKDIHLQEESTSQMNDRALPAAEILTDAREENGPDGAAVLFVP